MKHIVKLFECETHGAYLREDTDDALCPLCGVKGEYIKTIELDDTIVGNSEAAK